MRYTWLGLVCIIAGCSSIPKGTTVTSTDAKASDVVTLRAQTLNSSETSALKSQANPGSARPTGPGKPDVPGSAQASPERPPKPALIAESGAVDIAKRGSAVKAANGAFLSAVATTNRELLSGKYGDWTVGGSPDLLQDDPIWLVKFGGDFRDAERHYRFMTAIIDANSGESVGARFDP